MREITKATFSFRAPFHRPLNDEYRNPIMFTYQVSEETSITRQH